jgi:thiamine pyrophosphate-dependent acetolactate synthase large subunit-like protein
MIAKSQRPLILAGRGAAKDARTVLLELGDRTGALLATTAGAAGLFNGSAYNLGIAGGFASPVAKQLIKRSDLVLAFGASLNPWTLNHGSLLGPTARIVHIDDHAEALGRQHEVSLGVHADAHLAAAALLAELATLQIAPSAVRADPAVGEAVAGWSAQRFAERSGDGRIDPRTLTAQLDRMLPEQRTVAIDSGLFMGFPAALLTAPDPQGFVFAQGFMSVGLGLGVGIGAAIGRPDRLAVVAVGDGGTLMSLGELESLARFQLPMVVIIYNDHAYGAEVYDFAASPRHDGLVSFRDTDLAAVARALGMQGITVGSPEDFPLVQEWLVDRDGPLVIDAKINPLVVSEVWAD